MAKDEVTRNEIIACHQSAVKKLADKIEMEYLQTRSNGKTFLSRNGIMAEFMHTMARPTKSNDDIPDLDLHSHLVILNETFADGKNLSCEYEKLMDKSVIKELGLVYRQELAKNLQSKGYELEVTDSRQGFFELKGFDRETVMDFSNRRKEILQTAREHGLDMQTATIFSRLKKDEGKTNFDEILELTKREIFDSGKIKIEKNGGIENDEQKTLGDSRPLHLHEGEGRKRGLENSGRLEERAFDDFEVRDSLSDVSSSRLDREERGTWRDTA